MIRGSGDIASDALKRELPVCRTCAAPAGQPCRVGIKIRWPHRSREDALQCLPVRHWAAKHGEAGNDRRGQLGSAEYRIWSGIRQRCLSKSNKSYPNYGGRGILLCNRWLTFENFLNDLGRRPSRSHTVERIDNDRGYGPGNCRWAPKSEQSRNTRRSKLKADDVIAIRRRLACGELQAVIAADYGVCAAHISSIARRVLWRDV